MQTKQRQSAAHEAVTRARSRYGVGWDHIAVDAQYGAAIRIAIADFACFGQMCPASDLIAITGLIADIVENT